MATPTISPLKTCTKCKRELPETAEFFYRHKRCRNGLNSICKQCRADYQRKHLSVPENRERHRLRTADFRATHPEYVTASRRLGRIYRANRRQTGEDYAQLRAWYKTPKGRFYRQSKSNRRYAREQSAEGSYTTADIQLQLRAQRSKCWHCGKLLTKNFHIDHLIPISRGGSNDPRNIVISCPSCNMSKSDRLPQEWNGRLF